MAVELSQPVENVQVARRWQPQVVATIIAAMGIANLLWLVFPGQPILERIGRFLPMFEETIQAPEAFFSGIGMLYLAWGLQRGKRYAWLVSLSILAALTLLYTWETPYWSKLIPSAVLSAGLIWSGSKFCARTEPAAARLGMTLWAAGLLVSLVFGFLAAGDLPFYARLLAAINGALEGFVVSLPVTAAETAGWIDLPVLHFALGVLSWAVLFWMLDRPVAAPSPAGAAERQRARAIVQQYGRNSMAHLTLLDDKSYYFSPGGSVIAFTVRGRTAVTLGDPIGPREDALAAIQGMIEWAAHNDWQVVFSLTSGDYLDHYRRLGAGSLCLGHEGIIDLSTFSMKGNAAKTFRKRYNRLANLGYRMDVYEPPIAQELVAELHQVSDEWLSMAQAAEKGFFIARFTEAYVRNERLAVVRSPEGQVIAFANLVPEYQLNELSIDLMRRRRDIEPGIMDFLFVSLFLWAHEQGYHTFNMGLSPLFGVGSRANAPLLERFIYHIYEHGNFYDFKGLNGFKIKFRPAWAPQYLVYPSFFSLPSVGLALASVNAGEGETMLDYFKPRPKQVHHEQPDDLLLVDG